MESGLLLTSSGQSSRMSKIVFTSLLGSIFFLLPFTPSQGEVGTLFSTFSVLLFLLLGGLFWYKEKMFFVLYAPFSISMLWVALSNLYIENGGYIQEQLRFGEPTGSTVRYVFLSCVFSASAYVAYKIIRVKGSALKYRPYQLQLSLVHSFFVLLACLLLLSIILYGVPLLSGVDRFFYRENLPVVFLKVFPLIQIACFLLGVASYQKHALMRGAFMMSIMFVLLVLHAEKFTLLFWGGVFFAMGYLAAKLISGGNIKALKPALVCLALSSLFFLNVFFNYHVIHGVPYDKIFSQIMLRAFGLQGHVWYGIDELRMNGWEGLNPFESFFPMHAENKPSGLVALMYEVSPGWLVENYRDKGIRFTMGSPATALASFGYIGAAIYQLFGGLVVGGLLGYVSNSISRDNYAALFAALVAIKICMQVFLMGDFFEIYSPVMMVFYIFVLLDLLSRSVFFSSSFKK